MSRRKRKKRVRSEAADHPNPVSQPRTVHASGRRFGLVAALLGLAAVVSLVAFWPFGTKSLNQSSVTSASQQTHSAATTPIETKADQAVETRNEPPHVTGASQTNDTPPATEAERLAAEIRKAETLVSLGRDFDATKIYEKVCRQRPDDGVLANVLASLYLKQFRMREAAKVLARAREVAPAYFMTHVNLASLYFQTGKIQEALERARVAVRLAPEEPEAQYALGLVLAAYNQTDEALKAFDLALAKRPSDSRYLQAKCELLSFLYLWEEAAEVCATGIKVEPRNPVLQKNLGQAYLKLGRLKEAVTALEAAVSIDPNQPAVRKKLDRARLRLAKRKQADKQDG